MVKISCHSHGNTQGLKKTGLNSGFYNSDTGFLDERSPPEFSRSHFHLKDWTTVIHVGWHIASLKIRNLSLRDWRMNRWLTRHTATMMCVYVCMCPVSCNRAPAEACLTQVWTYSTTCCCGHVDVFCIYSRQRLFDRWATKNIDRSCKSDRALAKMIQNLHMHHLIHTYHSVHT